MSGTRSWPWGLARAEASFATTREPAMPTEALSPVRASISARSDEVIATGEPKRRTAPETSM